MSPEERLICSSISSMIAGRDLKTIPPVDWNRLYSLASLNRVIPILASQRYQGGMLLDEISPEAKKNFETEVRRRRMRAAVMIEEFHRVHSELEAAAIQTIPIKGIALAQQVYTSPSHRYFDDIDLLVREELGGEALRTLGRLGYVPHPRAVRQDWHHLMPHIHQAKGIMIEIHTDLIRRSRTGWAVDDIWDRSEETIMDNRAVVTLAHTDALIFATLHARHNLYNRLSYFIDGALLAREVVRLGKSWEEVLSFARDAGASCSLGYTLQTSQRLFNLENFGEFDCGDRRMAIATRIGNWKTLESKNAALRQGPLTRLMEVLLTDSWPDSLSLTARLLFPPRAIVTGDSSSNYSFARGLLFRFWRRTKQGVGQLLKMFQSNDDDQAPGSPG